VDSHGQSYLSHGTLKWGEGSEIRPLGGQWIPVDSPTCSMVQWDTTDRRI